MTNKLFHFFLLFLILGCNRKENLKNGSNEKSSLKLHINSMTIFQFANKNFEFIFSDTLYTYFPIHRYSFYSEQDEVLINIAYQDFSKNRLAKTDFSKMLDLNARGLILKDTSTVIYDSNYVQVENHLWFKIRYSVNDLNIIKYKTVFNTNDELTFEILCLKNTRTFPSWTENCYKDFYIYSYNNDALEKQINKLKEPILY